MFRSAWLGWGAGVGVVALVYHSAVWRLVDSEWNRPDFDYCWLIPPLMGWLLWERRPEFEIMPSRPSWAGSWAFAGAAFFLLLGELGGEFLSLYLSLWLAVLGISWSMLGWRKLMVAFFPLLLLLTAFPPPNYIYSRLTLGMQLLSTRLGVEFLHRLGVSAYREGNVIDLGYTQLEVVAACSGLRFLIPLLIVGMILTYYFRQAWWKRALLMFLTLPLAIIMNGLRIGASGLLAQFYGPAILEGAAHDMMGWAMFLLSALGLLGCMRLLGAAGVPLISPFPLPQAVPPSGAGRPASAQVLVGLLVLVAAWGFVRYRAMTPDVLPEARPLASFPLSFPGWQGRSVPMESQFIEALDFTDYVQIDFESADGRTVDFYVAWYQSQRKGESIHSPETCLRGGGWDFVHSGAVHIEIPGFGPVRVNRAVLEQAGRRMVSYFWFSARGRMLTNGVELKFATMWDALTMRRTDGALVRLITPLQPGEEEAAAEARLQEFLGQAMPMLADILPGRDLSEAAGTGGGS